MISLWYNAALSRDGSIHFNIIGLFNEPVLDPILLCNQLQFTGGSDTVRILRALRDYN